MKYLMFDWFRRTSKRIRFMLLFIIFECILMFILPCSFMSHQVNMKDVRSYINSTVSLTKDIPVIYPINSSYLGLKLNHSGRLYLYFTKISEDGIWIRGNAIDRNNKSFDVIFTLPRTLSWKELILPKDNICVIIHRVSDRYDEIYMPYDYGVIRSWKDESMNDKYIIVAIYDLSLNLNETYIYPANVKNVEWYNIFAFYAFIGSLTFTIAETINIYRKHRLKSNITKTSQISILLSIHYIIFFNFYAIYISQLNDLIFQLLPGIVILESNIDKWLIVTAIIPLPLFIFPQVCLFYIGMNESLTKEDIYISNLIGSLALLSITVTISAALFPKPLEGTPEPHLIMVLLRITLLILATFAGLFCFSWGIKSNEKENALLGMELSIAMGALIGIICSTFVSSYPSFIFFCSIMSIMPFVLFRVNKIQIYTLLSKIKKALEII